jgi:ketopantoate reductase
LPPYDYILLATKNIPDIPPTVVDLVTPALPKDNTHTTLILLQNGLNIEKPFLASHPTTPVLSGVSLIGSAELTPGQIVHDEPDKLYIGAFTNSNLPPNMREERAREFVRMYGAAGKTQVFFREDVKRDRWKKLVYNACLNPICAITQLDTGRIRCAPSALDGLVRYVFPISPDSLIGRSVCCDDVADASDRPAMREIVAAAKASAGVDLMEEEGDVVGKTIEMDPLTSYLKPSMQQDLEKVHLHPIFHVILLLLTMITRAIS